uniref:C-type lectin domain-containing protein n=1 Tax=Esox lucius TaxID=8010 RepID=A0A6Q2ZL62_ESOLU
MRVLTLSVLACVLVTLLGAEGFHGNDIYNCQPGYSLASNNVPHCYKLIQEKMGWTDALNYCQKEGGTLAAAHSINEYQLLLSMVKKTQDISAYAWVGLNDLDEEGKYVWTDGSNADFSWADGAIEQQYGEEDCVALNSYKGAEGFDDIKCNDGCTFICMTMAKMPRMEEDTSTPLI